MNKFLVSALLGVLLAFGAYANPGGVNMVADGSLSLFTSLQQQSNSTPGSLVAWLLAIGFLGLVVLRRTRSGPMI
jgi:hypothetical protein